MTLYYVTDEGGILTSQILFMSTGRTAVSETGPSQLLEPAAECGLWNSLPPDLAETTGTVTRPESGH